MILKVFPKIGVQRSIADAYSSLIDCYSNAGYAEKKAAGSLGGAVNGHTIELKNGIYTRIK